MTDVDTSSYPSAPALPAQKSLLDTVNQFQQTQSNQLAISQQKLNQANQALGYMTRAMGSLGPNASKDDYLAVGQNAVKMGLVPANMLSVYTQRLQAAPTARQFYDEFTTAAASHQEQINYHLGQPGIMQNGQTNTPIAQSPKFGIRATGLPIQTQNAPNTEQVDNNQTLPDGSPNPNYGQKVLSGAQPAQIPQGATPANTGIPGQYVPQGQPNRLPTSAQPQVNAAPAPMLPVSKGNITGPNTVVTGVDVQNSPNQQVQNRFPSPNGAAVGMPPMFDEGKKQLAADQDVATQKLTGIKNAQKALALLPGVESGPGTGPYQQALAFLKAQGILSTDPKDKTVVYQEINKYLNRYVQQSGLSQRSDAAQQLAESSNPNLMTQLNPALINLTRTAIGLDKVEAARPGAFESKAYQNYGQFRSSFPQSQDDRAYSLSDLPKPEAQKLYQTMKAKALAGDPEGIKFIKSLAIAHKQGL